MVLAQPVEHDSVPWNALPGQMSARQRQVARYRLPGMPRPQLHVAGPQVLMANSVQDAEPTSRLSARVKEPRGRLWRS
jgi:hypothetical protein